MGIIVMIILGIAAGWLASVIMGTNKSQGLIGDLVLGIVGALIGGMVMSLLGFGDISGLNLYSLVVAVMGSIILISLGRALMKAD